MKIRNVLTKNLLLRRSGVASFAFGLAVFGLAACGDDPASADDTTIVSPTSSADASVVIRSSNSEGGNATGTSAGSNASGADQPTATSSAASGTSQKNSSSSKKVETPVTEEVLNEPSMVVTGHCSATLPEIQKGEIAEWRFDRENGSVFETIMAPFTWEFPELGKTLKGNGLNKVDVLFPEAGTYTAKLNVDGTEISCGSLQVQGIPVVVNSCKPDKLNANAGDVVTWTVDATSDAEIVGYTWTYEGSDVVGSGATGSITTADTLHKVNVAPTVVVTNADKTAQRFTCESAYVINPNKVDYVFVKGGDAIDIPSAETWVVQIPADCATCTLVCQVQGSSLNVFVNDEALSEEPKVDYYGEGIGAYNGQKVQFRIETNASTVSCNVTPW